MGTHLSRAISIPEGSTLTEVDYRKFLTEAYAALKRHPQFFAPDEDINDLEPAHVLPAVAETVLAIYVGINDAVCNVVNENSAVPLDLVVAKPPVKAEYARNLIPSRGSADLTTDWHFRGDRVVRRPLLEGMIRG